MRVTEATRDRAARVVVLRTTPGTVLCDYDRLLKMAGFFGAGQPDIRPSLAGGPGPYVGPGSELVIKLNLSWTRYFPACSTAPWQLEGVVKSLLGRGYGAHDLIPVENRTVVTDPDAGAARNGWARLFDRYGLTYRPLTREKWVEWRPKGRLLVLDKIFPQGFSIPELFIGRPILHLPTLKTHGHSVTTGAVKNAFGGLLKEVRHFCHAHIHETLADLMTIQRELHPSVWGVMDGTVAGDGAGPRTMVPVVKNFILASSDSVALDAIAAKMMGYDPLAIDYLRLCNDMGLGVADPARIALAGDDVSAENFGFRTKRSFVIWGDQLLRKGPLRPAEGLLLRSPLAFWAPLASAVYHDWFWYPLIGAARTTSFLRTEWGSLARRYLEGV